MGCSWIPGQFMASSAQSYPLVDPGGQLHQFIKGGRGIACVNFILNGFRKTVEEDVI